MLLLPVSLTYSVSLTHLSILEHVVVTLYFPHSAAAATSYIKAVPSMSLKTSFCSVHGQRIPGVPKALCIATACTTKSLLLKASHWRCLWIPIALWHDLRPATPFISLPKGCLLERQWKQSPLPELPPWARYGSMGRRDDSSASCSLFFLCPRLLQMPFTASPSTHY